MEGQQAERGFLTGDALAPYKSARSDRCWWCGASSLTREHKFKRSDLVRMWSEEGLLWGDGDDSRLVKSARKSEIVRFRASLCAPCNNERSQPFDYAYEAFSDYVWENIDSLWRRPFLDMEQVYGKTWPAGTLNLDRYVAKHVSCRMVNDGYAAPASVADFLEQGPLCPNIQMALFKDRDLYHFYRRGLRDGYDTRGLWIAPAMGAVSRSRRRLTMYSSSLTVGVIGVMYRWDEDVAEVDPFYMYQQARIHQRHLLPAI